MQTKIKSPHIYRLIQLSLWELLMQTKRRMVRQFMVV